MNKTTFYSILFFLVFLIQTSFSQCPPNGNISLTTQDELDQFIIEYPNCTEINGDLIIGDQHNVTSYIFDLNGMQNIETISGSLYVVNNISLISLEGLENLTSIGNGLIIKNNDSLLNLHGIENVTSLASDLAIVDNNSLLNLEGINIDTVHHDLKIQDNGSLLNFQGLNVHTVEHDFHVEGNNSLVNFEGLGSFHLKNDVYINNNQSLVNLQGMENGIFDIINLNINNNESLTTLSGLEGLTIIYFSFACTGNSALTSLEALQNVTAIQGHILLNDNLSLVDFSGLENLNGVNGNLSINNCPSLESFNGLNNVTYIGDWALISNCPQITSFEGLDNLNSVALSFEIANNINLTNVEHLSNLGNVGNGLDIHDNPLLASLSGLENLGAGKITIQNNEILNDCTSICHILDEQYAEYLEQVYITNNIVGCNSREEVKGICDAPECPTDNLMFTSQAEVDLFKIKFPNCTEVNVNLFIGAQPNEYGDYTPTDIYDLSAFSNLTSVNGYLTIQYNPDLENLDPLVNINNVGQALTIRNNETLTDISGLENILNITGDLNIQTNAILNECGVVCTYIDNAYVQGSVNISDNALDCSSSIFIQESCAPSECPPFDLNYITQEQIDNFAVKYPNCTELQSVVINGADITNIDGFTNIESVNNLIIENTSIPDLSGLVSLKYANGLFLQYNNEMTSFSGLQNLETIENIFQINSNDNITSTENIYSLKYINGLFLVTNNDNLTDLSAFASIEYIESITLINNQNLETIASLEDGIVDNVSITNSNINSLNFLEFTSSLDDLNLSSNINLTNLTGLENLESIDNLTLENNDNLNSIEVLQNLTTIHEGLQIISNDNLDDCSTVCTLVENSNITLSSIHISNNGTNCMEKETILDNCNYSDCPTDDLTFLTQADLNQFLVDYPNCETLKVNVYIGDENSDISDLSPLTNITEIQGNLSIIQNSSLNTLSALSSLTKIKNSLKIGQNNLTDLAGLENLAEIGDDLFIRNENTLADISALQNITELKSLFFENLPQLPNFTGLDNILKIYGEFKIVNLDLITDFTGFTNLESIISENYFEIKDNDALVNFEGFDFLDTISVNDFVVENNNSLLNLEGLDNLVNLTVHFNFVWKNNDNLDNFKGLENLLHLEAKNMTIFENTNLKSFYGLNKLTSLGSSIFFHVTSNPNLESFSGLENLNSIYYLKIDNNDNLKTLQGFDNLASVNKIDIANNDNLECIRSLNSLTSAKEIDIHNNTILDNLEGLNQIETLELNILSITNNPALDDCSSICNLLDIANVAYTFQDNLENCNTSGNINCVESETEFTDTVLKGFYVICGDETFEHLPIPIEENETITFYDSYESTTPIDETTLVTEDIYYYTISNAVSGAVSCRNFIEFKIIPLNTPTLDPLTAECQLLEADIPVPTIDFNCVGELTGTTTSDLNFTEQGTFEIVWNFEGNDGEMFEITQDIIIEKTIPTDYPILQTINSSCSISAENIPIPTATDECTGEITATTDSNLNFTTNGSYQIIWDFLNEDGTTTSRIQFVNINDTIPPTPPVSLETYTITCGTTLDEIPKPTATDTCSGQIEGYTNFDFENIQTGNNEFTWIFKDENNNISTANQNIFLDSNTNSEIISCIPDQVVDLDNECSYILPNYVSYPYLIQDNCHTTFSFTQSPAVGTEIFTNTEVTIALTDSQNNVISCSFLVALHDSSGPTIQDFTQEMNHELEGTDTTHSLGDLSSEVSLDNVCDGNYTMEQTPEVGTELAIGSHPVQMRATDFYGNSAECTIMVHVKDDILSVSKNNETIPIHFYPNPTTGIIYLEYEQDISSISITDVRGRIIYFRKQNFENKIDLSSFSKGIYILNINDKMRTYSKKIILR
ncbi:T9SS type A sorting domain-containing protein [Aureivirga sp. CE67]|uniref:T9SS type A sorting domain-containing protein n=1 Tax=Aureivirga sp. CE67 TaxID=1788983 RepID=UPI0018C8EC44|nr:T9SS type A sorting domain-containing protein [Aureivirga sp. CE67]